MKWAICTFKPWATALAEGVLLHHCKDLFSKALRDVRSKPIFPSSFVLASSRKGDNGSGCESGVFREPLKFATAQFLVGDRPGVLPGFRLFQQSMTAQCLVQRGVV